MYIDKLDDIVNKYVNIYHSTTKMKPVNVISSRYIDLSKENNEKEPKSKIGYIVRILKYKNISEEDYTPNWVEQAFMFWNFLQKGVAKNKQKEFTIEKAIKKKGDKLYVKWKGCNNSFNNWIDKKDKV